MRTGRPAPYIFLQASLSLNCAIIFTRQPPPGTFTQGELTVPSTEPQQPPPPQKTVFLGACFNKAPFLPRRRCYRKRKRYNHPDIKRPLVFPSACLNEAPFLLAIGDRKKKKNPILKINEKAIMAQVARCCAFLNFPQRCRFGRKQT